MPVEFPVATTSFYPTRYTAQDHPGVFILSKERKQKPGYEWAVLTHKMQNREYEHHTDGIFIEVVSYQYSYLHLSCHMTAPTISRWMRNMVKEYPYNHFFQALFAGWVWYQEMLALLRERT